MTKVMAEEYDVWGSSGGGEIGIFMGHRLITNRSITVYKVLQIIQDIYSQIPFLKYSDTLRNYINYCLDAGIFKFYKSGTKHSLLFWRNSFLIHKTYPKLTCGHFLLAKRES